VRAPAELLCPRNTQKKRKAWWFRLPNFSRHFAPPRRSWRRWVFSGPDPCHPRNLSRRNLGRRRIRGLPRRSLGEGGL